MKKYKKTHKNSLALAKHVKVLKRRKANIEVNGNTITYSFPSMSMVLILESVPNIDYDTSEEKYKVFKSISK